MKAFSDPDPIEEYLCKRVTEMTKWELVTYLKSGLKALYDIELIAEDWNEQAIMQRLQKVYGQRDAGLIVKWVCWKHRLRDQGAPVRFTSFSKGRKWWVDGMHAEMQQHLAKELRTEVTPSDESALWLLDH